MRRAHRIASAVALWSIICVVCTPRSAAAATSAAERKSETKLLAKINGERTKVGQPTLVEHAFILGEVRSHSVFNADTPAAPPHDGFEGRVERIMAADSGIGAEICENEAFTKGYTDPKKVARAFYAFWKSSAAHNACMHDLLGWTSTVGAVGIEKRGVRWWGTLIVAADSTP